MGRGSESFNEQSNSGKESNNINSPINTEHSNGNNSNKLEMSQCNVNESLMESQKENTIENVDNSTNVSYTWHPDNDLENEECHLFDDNIKQELRSTPNLYNENPDQNNATEYISCEQGED